MPIVLNTTLRRLRNRCVAAFTFALAGVGVSFTAIAQAPTADAPTKARLSPLTATRLSAQEKITLDGKLDEAVWQRMPVISEFYAYRPRDIAPPGFRTEVRVAYDHDALYLGLLAIDPDPSRIEAPLVRRDQVFGTQDFVAFHIDPTGNRKFAQIFRVNAAGSIGDGLFNEDTTNEDFAPDFEWQVATQRLPNGWSAELRIPFSTLRYSSPASPTWSISVIRGLTRDGVYRLANGRIPRDFNCLQCYAQTLEGMIDLPSGREFTVTPNTTWRSVRDEVNGVAQTSRKLVVGTEIKFRPTPDLVFDATINPDFSQVELDSPQLAANAQFALFYPEKRPFFLEGADILSLPLNAIYTRSITDPAWGARLTRRADNLDFTFLTARDDGKGLILLPRALGTDIAIQDSKSTATIGRLRAHAGSVTWGAVLTDREYDKRNGKAMWNRVVGGDAVWREGAWRVRGNVLYSDTRDERNRVAGEAVAYRDTAVLADYGYTTGEWGAYGGWTRVGRDFRADNGFFGQADYENVYQETQRKFKDVWGFSEIGPFINMTRKTDTRGKLLYEEIKFGLPFIGEKTSFGVEFKPNQLLLVRPNSPPLKRDQVYAWVEGSPATWLSRYYIETAVGDRADIANNRIGRGYFLSANATIRLFDRWEIEPRIDESVINSIEPVNGSKRINHERATQISSVYHLTARDSLRIIAQYNGVRRAPSLYESRVTPFNKNEVLSVVYGHRRGLGTNVYFGMNQSKSLEPAAKFTGRNTEWFVKASWAVDLAR